MTLCGKLLKFDDDKLSGFERREADLNIHHTVVDVGLGRDF